MKYGKARAIVESALEQLDEKKLFDPVFGHAGIDKNPRARKFNPKTARTNKVKKRNFEMRVGRAGYGLSNPESRSVNDGRHMLRQRINEAIEQIDELSDSKLRGYVMKSAYNAAVDAPTHGVKKRLKGIGTALKSMAGYRSKKK